jgi:glutamate synthase domain-containing protein 3
MTGGTVVILGKTGRNFGAGMTGGVAFVLDEESDLEKLYNPELICLERLAHLEDVKILQSLILRHQALTGSRRAQEILERWDRYLSLFWKIMPRSSDCPALPRLPIR